ncbi:MAG: hypothetical protein KIT72_06140 [Polyangiaceae bacterium]|nr:hypothetical protein [Polyangiaceae bacterium]MCW5789980.1 hypothetical protein [Polyangiaceae bacterium]
MKTVILTTFASCLLLAGCFQLGDDDSSGGSGGGGFGGTGAAGGAGGFGGSGAGGSGAMGGAGGTGAGGTGAMGGAGGGSGAMGGSGGTDGCAGCEGCCYNNTCLEWYEQSDNACGINGAACLPCPNHLSCGYGCDQLADNAQFEIVIDHLRVSTRNGAGEAWDAFGGAPDPFVCVGSGCTTYFEDTFTCNWSDGTIGGSSPVRFSGYDLKRGVVMEVWDKDVSSNDLMGRTTLYFSEYSSFGYATGPFGAGVLEVEFRLR